MVNSPQPQPPASRIARLLAVARKQLVRGGLGSLLVKATSAGAGLFITIVLARALGPEGYGLYAYVLSLVSLLSVPAQAGLPVLVVRETAKARATESWGSLRGLWRWSSAVAGVSALVLASVALAIGWAIRDALSREQLLTFALGLVLVPLATLGDLRGAALRGLQRVVLGQVPEFVLRPGLLLTSLLLFQALVPARALTPVLAMGLHIVAAGASFAVGATILFRARPEALKAHPRAVYDTRSWLRSVLPLALVSSLILINQHTDIVMLGVLGSEAEVGIYRLSVSASSAVAFGLQAISMVVAPQFAALHAAGRYDELQRVVRQSARMILALATPAAILLAAFGRPLLAWLAGVEFASGSAPLTILVLGQVINAAMGSVGALLNMTGHERDTARGVAVAAAVNVALNAALIPLWGMVGAATATAASMATWNFLLWRAVKERLNIESMAFSRSRRRPTTE